MGCSIDVDCEWPELFHEKIVTARKDHRCCECHETIGAGEKYEHVRGMWDGVFSTYKTCIPCQSIRKEYCCSWFYEQLRDTLKDEIGIDYLDPNWKPLWAQEAGDA